ncbi:MAG: ribonuclease P protein component [Vicinamibacterales bacterium]
MPQTFPPDARLRRRSEFTGVFEKGVKRHGRLMSVCVRRAGSGRSRVGIAASRKVGGAVQRNLVKRRVREIFRRLVLPAGLDIVVMPRQAMVAAPLDASRQEFEALVQSAARHGRSAPHSQSPRPDPPGRL